MEKSCLIIFETNVLDYTSESIIRVNAKLIEKMVMNLRKYT